MEIWTWQTSPRSRSCFRGHPLQRDKNSVEGVLALHIVSEFEQCAALPSKLVEQSVDHLAKAND